MRRNDFKDALNELQLKQSFCEKMEKKLSEAEFNNDGYYDEVVHVDVVPKRTKRSFAIAAALVLALGVGGTGTALKFRDKIHTELSIDDDEGNDENSIDETDLIDDDDERKCEFDFPFGRIDLNGLSFSYGYYYAYYNTSSNYNQAQELLKLFESIDWKVYKSYTQSNFNSVISDNDIIEPDQYYGNGSVYVYHPDDTATDDNERISVYSQDRQYSISFLSDGMVAVVKQNYNINPDEVTADNCYIYTYKIPVEKFKEIKNLMFGDQHLGYIHSLGIKADLNGADFKIDGDEGKLSTVQALEIANIINVTSNWSLIGENIDIPDYHKSISIRFREDDKVCEFKFIDSDNYLIINESSLKGEHIRTRLYQSDFDRYLTLKVLFNNGMECDFSPELGDADHAYITIVKDGTVTGRQVSREKLDALLHDNVNMKWYDIYTPPTPSDYNAAVFINIGNKIISFYKMGDYAYCFDYVDDCFRFEGFDYLTKWALDLPEPAKDATEYVHQWLNEVLSNKEIHISSFNNMENSSATYYTIEDTERLKQIFSEFDWECISSVKHIPYLSSVFLPDDSYYSGGITITETEKTMYFIDNGLDTILIRSNGIISSSHTGCTYQCSDPDKMLKAIDELLKDSPKKIY